MYGLFIMMLFRTWRSPTEATAEWLRDLQHQPNLSVDEVWGQLCDEYSRWRTDDVVAVAEPYFNRTGPQLPEPSFVANATEWWACMVYQKMQHLELVLSRNGDPSFDHRYQRQNHNHNRIEHVCYL